MKEPIGLVSLIVLSPLLIIDTVFWFSVRTRRGVLFGVSVPLEFSDTPSAAQIISLYRLRLSLLTIAAALACVGGGVWDLSWLLVLTTPVAAIAGFASWQLARRQVKPHEVTVPLQRKAGLGLDSGASAVWFAVTALALTPLGYAWLYLRRHWDQIPMRFPTHWDIHGVANQWSVRSNGAVAMPVIIGAAVILFMIFVAAFMRLVPIADRQRASRVMFPTLAALSWSLSMVFCWIALMPLRPSFSSTLLIGVILGHLLVVAAIVGWMTFQLMRTQGREAYDGTPDAMWRAGGLVYYNPSDAAVMVPQRLGWGWTFNFARPAAWWYLGVVLLLAAGIGVASVLLK